MPRLFAAAFAAATLAAPGAALRRGGGAASAELLAEASLISSASSEQRASGHGHSIDDEDAAAAFAAMWNDDEDDEDDDADASSPAPDDSSLSSSKLSRASREEHPRRGAGAASIGAVLASARRSAPVAVEKADAASEGHHRKGHHHRSRSGSTSSTSSSSSSHRSGTTQRVPPQVDSAVTAPAAATTAAAAAGPPPRADGESSRLETASEAERALAEKEEREREKAAKWLIYAGIESYVPSTPPARKEVDVLEPPPPPHGRSSWDAVLRFATETYIDPSKTYCQDKRPYAYKAARLLVFDFDETLTISTWSPDEKHFPEFYTDASWSKEELVERLGADFCADLMKRCFSPARLEMLRELLRELAADPERRTLAILTRNRGGAVGVLNILKLADLDMYFQVIWAFPGSGRSLGRQERGVVRVQKVAGADVDADTGAVEWTRFRPGEPLRTVIRTKESVLRQVTMNPRRWLPHLDEHAGPLAGLSFEEVILIDDAAAEVTGMDRFCKVPRVTQPGGNPKYHFSGGIGAKYDEDFHTLRAFLSFLEEKAEHPVVYSPLLVARSVMW